jgi:hypothetical protein
MRGALKGFGEQLGVDSIWTAPSDARGRTHAAIARNLATQDPGDARDMH